MLFCVYVLESAVDGNKYIGFSRNLKQRLEEHNKGLAFSTKLRRPMKLIYYEACLDQVDALRRERYLKTTNGHKFLVKRLRSYYSSKL